jgi:hypothetical protein
LDRRGKLLTIVLLCAATGLPAQQATRRVLHDYRIDGASAPIKGGAELSLKDQQRVLSALFPKYLTSESACDRANEDKPHYGATLETERTGGQIVPSIEEFVDGSFTAAGKRQTAYFVKVGECFAYTRDYWGTYRLAIFEGPRLIADVEPEVPYQGTIPMGSKGLVATADVNNDGIDELLLQSTVFGGGELEVYARLVSLGQGKFHAIREFDDVYDWGCGANRNVTASRITYTPPTLFVERYEAPCKGAVKLGHVPALSDFKRLPQGSK